MWQSLNNSHSALSQHKNQCETDVQLTNHADRWLHLAPDQMDKFEYCPTPVYHQQCVYKSAKSGAGAHWVHYYYYYYYY